MNCTDRAKERLSIIFRDKDWLARRTILAPPTGRELRVVDEGRSVGEKRGRLVGAVDERSLATWTKLERVRQ